MARDYYAVLGVTRAAPAREIRSSFRRLARQYSPDINVWEERAVSLYAEIVQAWRVLGDPEARALYDSARAAGPGEGPRRGSPAAPRGADAHATVELSFAEAARGAAVDVTVERESPCDACAGRETAREVAEPAACPACRGRGTRLRRERVRVQVRGGVESGDEVRVRGEGHAAVRGGPRGDLLVNTRVRPHPHFVRRGDGTHCEVAVTVWEALLGVRLTVPTPTGEAALVLSPGTEDGREFRLRGQGVPRRLGQGLGDLFVTVRLALPGGLDAGQVALVRELERLVPMSVRAGLERYRGGDA